MQTVDEILKNYSPELKIEIENIQKCQEEKEVKSCFTCKNFYDCEIRKKYVQTVYDSMSHGESGGFEF
ncbi:MAG: hypothetical protein ACK5LP_06260 [Campylobacteraceae bacterium]